MLFGTLEAGGTKMVLSVGNESNEILELVVIPTESPDRTIPEMIAWFGARNISALGIGTFGPVDLNPASPAYGCITQTPKPGWRDTPLLPRFRSALQIPVEIDTDVNAAALAEWQLEQLPLRHGRYRHRRRPGDRGPPCPRTHASGTGTYASPQ